MFPTPSDSRSAENLENIGNSGQAEPCSSSSNLDESSLNPSISDTFGQGISCMLSSVIRNFDFRAENAVKSQDQLSCAIDRLTRELDQLLEDAPLPFIMQHAAKISSVRKRVSSLNLLLKSIQRRIDKIDQMLSTSLSHEKPSAKNDSQHQH